jgi:hypothetical protein
MLAIARSFPPQRRQVSMSMANTRLRRGAQVRDRCRSAADGSADSTAWLAAATRVLGTTRARSGLAGANTPWQPGQVRAGLWHQYNQSGDKVLGLEDDVRGAVPIRCLQRAAHEPAFGQRQPFSRHRRPCDIARQVLELVALRSLRGDARVQRDKIAGSDFAPPKAGPKGAGQDARSNPELSATSRRGSSGSAGSICSVNTLALSRPGRDPVVSRRRSFDIRAGYP